MNRTNLKIWGLKAKSWATVMILCELIIIISLIGFAYKQKVTYAEAQGQYKAIYQSRETLIENPTTEQEEIIAYIKEVFGTHSAKAFKLLSCENKSLNPNALHDNEKWGQGRGQDLGVFQINNYWQQTQGKFLRNWKINIEIAYQLYKENGYQFNLWTCGRNLGI